MLFSRLRHRACHEEPNIRRAVFMHSKRQVLVTLRPCHALKLPVEEGERAPFSFVLCLVRQQPPQARRRRGSASAVQVARLRPPELVFEHRARVTFAFAGGGPRSVPVTSVVHELGAYRARVPGARLRGAPRDRHHARGDALRRVRGDRGDAARDHARVPREIEVCDCFDLEEVAVEQAAALQHVVIVLAARFRVCWELGVHGIPQRKVDGDAEQRDKHAHRQLKRDCGRGNCALGLHLHHRKHRLESRLWHVHHTEQPVGAARARHPAILHHLASCCDCCCCCCCLFFRQAVVSVLEMHARHLTRALLPRVPLDLP
mmetsp:Transcript_54252/g.110726  ORF Transcript_54252/g.110726 Transcript_54252/m.110726 type:complete len:317 (+) Transcript_54252:855-1805(+)